MFFTAGALQADIRYTVISGTGFIESWRIGFNAIFVIDALSFQWRIIAAIGKQSEV